MATTIDLRHLQLSGQSPRSCVGASQGSALSTATHGVSARRRLSAAAYATNQSLPTLDTEKLLRGLSLHDSESQLKSPPIRTATSELRQRQFQRYREFLWKNGRARLNDRDGPHINVAPVRLPPMTTAEANLDTITIYAVIHSEGHSPVGLRRDFDRCLLSATVPEPSRSPLAPNFDREELLSTISDANKTLAARKFRHTTNKSATALKRETSLRRAHRSSIPDGLPIHLDYARAQLPVLASIMMSRPVRFGDTIELPLPFPEAWAETVAWVYIGGEDLATSKVVDNIRYLGGRVLKK